MEIDTELNEKRTKLQVYEKVEQELDEVVMQAAQGNQHTIIISLFSVWLKLIELIIEMVDLQIYVIDGVLKKDSFCVGVLKRKQALIRSKNSVTKKSLLSLLDYTTGGFKKAERSL